MGPRLWIVHLLLGFSSGLPLLLTASTLQVWMTELGVPLAIIGGLASVGLPYNFKFVWSPFIDRFPLPFLTRRRGWMVLIQVLMMLAIAGLGFTHPEQSVVITFAVAALVAFLSATQDILIDAYRRENLPDEKMGYGLSLYTTGYRLAMLVAGAVALWSMQAYQLSWPTVYTGLAACVLIGIFAALIAPESADATAQTPKTFEEAIVGPFKQLFSTKNIWLILVFLLLYKLGDNLSSSMTAPFVIKHGYTKGDYAKLVKGVGLLSTLAGVYVGAWVMEKITIARSLWVFGVLQAIAILSLYWLAQDSRVAYMLPYDVIKQKLWFLSFAIFCEMFTAGMAVPAFNTFVALLTDRKFTATQYALLTSLVALPRTLLSTPSGWIAGQLGWENYFLFCVLTTIPGLFLLSKVAPWNKNAANS
ncbi:MAG: AmpG family muropeptide MFS transporter [Bdellovibrionales bacterium]|nr:AmpG family muropeptide MFS transporter [Bdellovibrionales bacterium]